MIDSNIIEWLDFNDSNQNIDIYSKRKLILFFNFLRVILKNKNFPFPISLFFIFIYFIQICAMSLMFFRTKGDIILNIIDYLKENIIFFEIINEKNFAKNFIILFVIIVFDILLIIVVFFLNEKYNLFISIFIINFLN